MPEFKEVNTELRSTKRLRTPSQSDRKDRAPKPRPAKRPQESEGRFAQLATATQNSDLPSDCELPSLQFPGPSVQLPVSSAQCPVPSLQCPVSSLQVPVLSVQCPVPSLQFRVLSVQVPVPSLRFPDPSVQCPVPSLQCPEPSIQFPVSSAPSPVSVQVLMFTFQC